MLKEEPGVNGQQRATTFTLKNATARNCLRVWLGLPRHGEPYLSDSQLTELTRDRLGAFFGGVTRKQLARMRLADMRSRFRACRDRGNVGADAAAAFRSPELLKAVRLYMKEGANGVINLPVTTRCSVFLVNQMLHGEMLEGPRQYPYTREWHADQPPVTRPPEPTLVLPGTMHIERPARLSVDNEPQSSTAMYRIDLVKQLACEQRTACFQAIPAIWTERTQLMANAVFMEFVKSNRTLVTWERMLEELGALIHAEVTAKRLLWFTYREFVRLVVRRLQAFTEQGCRTGRLSFDSWPAVMQERFARDGHCKLMDGARAVWTFAYQWEDPAPGGKAAAFAKAPRLRHELARIESLWYSTRWRSTIAHYGRQEPPAETSGASLREDYEARLGLSLARVKQIDADRECHYCGSPRHRPEECVGSGLLCNICYRLGHSKSECAIFEVRIRRALKGRVPSEMGPPACARCYRVGHTENGCRIQPLCGLCDQNDHITRACPSRNGETMRRKNDYIRSHPGLLGIY